MPVGAVIGSAVVGAGASAMAASKNSKAIRKSTDAQTAANDKAIAAQEKARAENLALQRPIYNAGMPAMQARNALLGLVSNDNTQSLPTTQPNALAAYQGPYSDTSAMPGAMPGVMTMPGPISGFGGGTFDLQGNPVTVGTQGQPAPNAGSAFDTFRNSTGYQFRLGEGMNALNSGYAGAGTLQSGAAMKAALKYGQDYASGEFGNYMGYLGEQQNLASGAANAMSGVNTTYANNAGNLAMQQGQNLVNAAVARANNSNQLMMGIGGAVAGTVNTLGGMGRL